MTTREPFPTDGDAGPGPIPSACRIAAGITNWPFVLTVVMISSMAYILT